MLGNHFTNEEEPEITVISFCRRMLRMIWMEHMTNKEVLKRIEAIRKLLQTIRKRISGTNNEERLGEFNTHKAYLRQRNDYKYLSK